MGRSLYYQDAKGAYERLGDMNKAECDRLLGYNVFSVSYTNLDKNEVGFHRNDNSTLDEAAQFLSDEEPANGVVMLLLYRLRAWTDEGAFLLW